LQSRYKDICEAFIIDAKEDLKSSKVLLEKNIFSKSVYHSQHAIQKKRQDE